MSGSPPEAPWSVEMTLDYRRLAVGAKGEAPSPLLTVTCVGGERWQ